MKKEFPEAKVEKDATAEDLFSAHNFDITIDLGKNEETGGDYFVFLTMSMFQMFLGTTLQPMLT